METDKTTHDKTTHDKIELRSEKVRQIIGEVPPSLVRWGTAIIAVVFIALIAAVSLLPYPHSDGESILQHLIGQQRTTRPLPSH